MRALLHLVGFCAYTVLAAATALHAPVWLPQLDQVQAYGLAGSVFLAGALLHQVLAHAARIGAVQDRLLDLGHDAVAQQEELDWLRREIAGLREALGATGESGELRRGGRTVDEVMAEVKVLKSVMRPLSGNPGAPSVPAATGQARATAGQVRAARKPPPGVLPPVTKNLDEAAVLEAVRGALRNDHIELVLQPIVSLPQRKRRFYECFSRLRTEDGGLILPDQYIAVAERAGLITAVDNMLLFRCVQLIRRIQRSSENVDFFCNISPHTLADGDFFSDFIDFLENNEELAGHLVFEFAQADFARWSEVGVRLLERLSHLGCRVSLDQVRDLDLDPVVLAKRRVSFLKVEVKPLLKALRRNGDLLSALRRQQIDLIAEKVEDENRLLDLLDYEIDFGQGYLFGEPRLARPAA